MALTSSTGAPASIKAPKAMSPAMPEKQWNQAAVMGQPDRGRPSPTGRQTGELGGSG